MTRQVNGHLGTFSTIAELTAKFPPSEHIGCSANVGTTTPYVKAWCDGVQWNGITATQSSALGELSTLVKQLRASWLARVAVLQAQNTMVPNTGTVVYIDPNVAGPGAGSLADPFNAPPALSGANTTYLFAEGTTYVGALTIAASGVVLGTYERGTGRRVIDKSRIATIDANAAQIAITRSGAGITGWTVSGLKVKNARHATAPRGIYFSTGGGTGLTVEHCVIEDIEPTTTSTSSVGIQTFANDTVIRFCTIRLRNSDCIWLGDNGGVGGENPSIYGNEIQVLGTTTMDGPDGIQMANAHGFKSLRVEGNWIDVSKVNCKQSIIIQDTSGGTTGTLGGVVGWNVGLGADASLPKLSANGQKCYELSVPNVKIHGNVAINSEFGINTSGASCDVRGNLIVQNSTEGGQALRGISSGGTSTVVEHNTIVATKPFVDARAIDSTTTSGSVKQNVISGGWSIGIKRVTSEESNVVFNTTVPFVNASVVAVSAGTGSVTTNPMLANFSEPTIDLTSQSTLTALDRDVFNHPWNYVVGAVQM